MATVAKLAESGKLIYVDAGLAPGVQPDRVIYATVAFRDWAEQKLPQLHTQLVGGRETPLEQLDALFERFAVGRPMQRGRQFRCLVPVTRGVWELKTPDIRIFGWFPLRDVYIAVAGADASIVKDYNLYGQFRSEVVRVREAMPLDEPKYVEGNNPDAVVSASY